MPGKKKPKGPAEGDIISHNGHRLRLMINTPSHWGCRDVRGIPGEPGYWEGNLHKFIKKVDISETEPEWRQSSFRPTTRSIDSQLDPLDRRV